MELDEVQVWKDVDGECKNKDKNKDKDCYMVMDMDGECNNNRTWTTGQQVSCPAHPPAHSHVTVARVCWVPHVLDVWV